MPPPPPLKQQQKHTPKNKTHTFKCHFLVPVLGWVALEEDEINVPMALSVFRDGDSTSSKPAYMYVYQCWRAGQFNLLSIWANITAETGHLTTQSQASRERDWTRRTYLLLNCSFPPCNIPHPPSPPPPLTRGYTPRRVPVDQVVSIGFFSPFFSFF